MASVIPVQKRVLSQNARIAEELREKFARSGVTVVNLISSPGSGKTRLLERTLESLSDGLRAAVLTGDLQTEADAQRLSRFGYPVQQIATGGACRLDATMIERHLTGWDLNDLDLLLIESVGTLACPSSYDLGEEAKVVLFSVAEGEERPLEYPSIFYKSRLIVLTKTDLLPFVPFDIELAKRNARSVNASAEIIEVSCRSGEGLARWMSWLEARVLRNAGALH